MSMLRMSCSATVVVVLQASPRPASRSRRGRDSKHGVREMPKRPVMRHPCPPLSAELLSETLGHCSCFCTWSYIHAYIIPRGNFSTTRTGRRRLRLYILRACVGTIALSRRIPRSTGIRARSENASEKHCSTIVHCRRLVNHRHEQARDVKSVAREHDVTPTTIAPLFLFATKPRGWIKERCKSLQSPNLLGQFMGRRVCQRSQHSKLNGITQDSHWAAVLRQPRSGRRHDIALVASLECIMKCL